MNNQNNVFTFCRRFVRVQMALSEKKRKLANMISLVLPAEADQTAALRAISKTETIDQGFFFDRRLP
jgi:hypothetical protein